MKPNPKKALPKKVAVINPKRVHVKPKKVTNKSVLDKLYSIYPDLVKLEAVGLIDNDTYLAFVKVIEDIEKKK